MSAPRIRVPGYPYHVVIKAIEPLKLFANDEERRIFIECFRVCALKYGLLVVSWCILSTHAHFIVVPLGEESLSKAIGEACHLYVQRVNRRRRRSGGLCQRPFWSTVMDEAHFLASLPYVEYNPVRAGVVVQPQDYPFSSALHHLGLASTDPLVETLRPFGLDLDWTDLLKRDRPEAAVTEEAARRGVPIGAAEHLRRISEATGLPMDSWIQSDLTDYGANGEFRRQLPTATSDGNFRRYYRVATDDA